MEYLDLYTVHWPISSRPGTYEFPVKKENLLPMDFKSVWAAMEECQQLGLTKAIGVSNFSCKKLSDILAIAKIPPVVNQVIFLVDLEFLITCFFYFMSYNDDEDVVMLKGRDKPTMATEEAEGIL